MPAIKRLYVDEDSTVSIGRSDLSSAAIGKHCSVFAGYISCEIGLPHAAQDQDVQDPAEAMVLR